MPNPAHRDTEQARPPILRALDASGKNGQPAAGGNLFLCHCVLDSLHRASPDNLSGRHGFEYRRLLTLVGRKS
jgi:hypothetical protein